MSHNAPQFVHVAEVSRLIAHDRQVVIYEGHALDLSSWIDRHPGGRLPILHMVGRDATDEINMSVPTNS